MSDAMVAIVVRSLLSPLRRTSVTELPEDGVHLIVVDCPACRLPPVGEEIGLLWAAT